MLKRFAVGASLAALLTACGGGSPANNQSTMSTNVQGNQGMSSTNMMEPIADESGNALSNAPTPVTADTAPAEAAPAEKTPAAAPAKEKARNAAAPATRPSAAAPKATPAPRTADRNQTAPRTAPRAEPTTPPKVTCTPEHRAMGHC
jgi:hypothetical protein